MPTSDDVPVAPPKVRRKKRDPDMFTPDPETKPNALAALIDLLKLLEPIQEEDPEMVPRLLSAVAAYFGVEIKTQALQALQARDDAWER